jgi:hypothetical protein
MEPVRLKVYGIALTRRGYVTLQVLMMLLLGALIALLYAIETRAPQSGLRPWQEFVALVVRNLYWIVPVALVLDGVEVLLVLRRFAEKEALQRKRGLSEPEA